MGKITAKATTEKICDDLHLLVVQTEDDVPVLRRLPAQRLFDAFGANGLQYEGNQLTLLCGDEELGNTVTIVSGSGGGDGGSTITIVNNMVSKEFTVISSAESCVMDVTCTSLDNSTGEATGKLTAVWSVNGTRVKVENIAQGQYNTFDIRKYLTDGSTNTVKLNIEDAYGNTKPFTWTITVSAFTMTWNLAELAYHGAGSASVRVVPVGTGTKTVHVSLDGTEIHTEEVSVSGRTVTVDIPAQAHGAHTITAWLTATMDGIDLSTEPLSHVGIWSEADNTMPVIGVATPTISTPQYSTYNILWMVYDPAAETASVTQSVNGVATNFVTADRTIQTWAYRPTEVGSDKLLLYCGDAAAPTASAPISVTVTSLGYDIREVGGAEIDIDPTGHANTETGRENFGYTDATGVVHPFTFSDNFDWTNGGFKQDDDGVTAFVIRRGTYVTIDRSLFDDNAKETGKEIKVVFKSTNVRDYNSEILNCVSGGIGLKLQAQQAVLSSNLETRNVSYCEGRKIELDINVESTASSENRFAMMWLKGVPSRTFVYSTDDTWTQPTPTSMKIGSDECDVWLYRFKMYPYSLTKREILDNFIADCADPYEMIDRYERNNIYNDSGNIDMIRLAAARPDLRVIHISAARMTTGKEDKLSCTIQHTYQGGGNTHCWLATNAIFRAQGTSSLDYAAAALNMDIDMSGATWVDNDGNVLSGYAMTENSIPVSYFNLKLNVASSESANNVLLADLYNTYQPWKSAARREDPRVRDTVEGHPCVVFFTNTSNATITVGSHTVAAGQTILYGCGDMNNSKKNTKVFGQDNEKYPLQCCVEILNNNNAQCKFQSADLSAETWGGTDGDSFEFRYGGTDEHKALFQKMLSWVVSTNPAAATGAVLTTPQVINGVTYANDTASYRGAKFKAEVGDWFIVDSLLYHYVFTEHFCMPDNRAKNTFVSYEYCPDIEDYRWNFTKDYDNDTGMGNDNSGGLTFTYGLEDTDTIGVADVFNASDSVLWTNIRDFMFPELQAMYQTCESAGLFKAETVAKIFTDYQSARPEALVIEDMYAKYITPYLATGETRYFNMLYGTKEDQRYQFLIYQERYMATKYMSTLATKDSIEFRCNTPTTYAGVAPSGNMVVTPYSDMYIIVKYGNAGTVRIRAKQGVATPITCPTTDLADTETYVYLASNVTALTGLAGLYTKLAVLSSATRLQIFELGSGEGGYSNSMLTSISFGNNTLLEYIDLRGTPSLVQSLDLTGLTSLETILVTSSGVTGVSFAVGAPVKVAKLSSLTSLSARGLAQLETFEMNASKLERLRVEGSPAIDTYSMVAAATKLATGRLTDVEWEDADPDVMLRLATLPGLSADGKDITDFALTGSVNITALTEDELAYLVDEFPDVAFTYDSIVTAYSVYFANWDGTILNEQKVRYGSAAVNPVTAGYIDAPTKASTEDTNFAFAGWDVPFNNITVNTTVTAIFRETTRYYTVSWMYDASTPLYSEQVEAHATIEYNGSAHGCADELTPPELGQLWMGWDKPTNDILSDIVVTAIFVAPVMPDVIASNYDFLYSDDPDDNRGYTLEEFYGICYNGRAEEFFEIGDKIKIVPVTNVFADTEIILEVYGFKHFKLANSTEFAGVVFGMVGLMNATQKMNTTNINTGGWPATFMRDYLNETVLVALPRQWQAMIKSVQVLSSAGNTSASIVSSNDKLFLFSRAEVGFNAADVPYVNEVDADADEITFSRFTDNNSRIKKGYNGTGAANYWWLRSPEATGSTYFGYVGNFGNSYSNSASYAYGVSWGFCM